MAKLLRITKEEFGHYLLLFGLPITLFLFIFIVSKSQAFYAKPEIFSPAIILDLVVTIPMAMAVIFHKKNISKFYVLPILLFGVLLVGKLIPLEYQGSFYLIKYLLIPIVEITIVFTVIRKVYLTIDQHKGAKKSGHTHVDFYDGLCISVEEHIPKRVAHLVINEIATIYYLLNWNTYLLKDSEYSYHKKGGGAIISYVLLCLVAVETFVAHVLLEKWNSTVAWVLTILSLYTMIQILGMIKGTKFRPITIKDNILHLRYSFINEVAIPIEDIIDIEETRRSLSTRDSTVMLSALGELETQNLVIHLKHKFTLKRIYGLESSFKSIGIFVDEKDRFLEELTSRRHLN